MRDDEFNSKLSLEEIVEIKAIVEKQLPHPNGLVILLVITGLTALGCLGYLFEVNEAVIGVLALSIFLCVYAREQLKFHDENKRELIRREIRKRNGFY